MTTAKTTTGLTMTIRGARRAASWLAACVAILVAGGCGKQQRALPSPTPMAPQTSPSAQATTPAQGQVQAQGQGQAQGQAEPQARDPNGAGAGGMRSEKDAPATAPPANGGAGGDGGAVEAKRVAFVKLDAATIDASFRPKLGEVSACFDRGAQKHPWLTGVFEIKVRLDATGKIGWIATSKPLGDDDVERCVVDVASQVVFPPLPAGAEAEFTHSFTFRGRGVVDEWESARVGEVFALQRSTLDHCNRDGLAGGLPPSLRVALFVTAGGVASSVGVGADAPLDGAWSRCVAREIGGWKFPEPAKGHVAHVVYQF